MCIAKGTLRNINAALMAANASVRLLEAQMKCVVYSGDKVVATYVVLTKLRCNSQVKSFIDFGSGLLKNLDSIA